MGGAGHGRGALANKEGGARVVPLVHLLRLRTPCRDGPTRGQGTGGSLQCYTDSASQRLVPALSPSLVPVLGPSSWSPAWPQHLVPSLVPVLSVNQRLPRPRPALAGALPPEHGRSLWPQRAEQHGTEAPFLMGPEAHDHIGLSVLLRPFPKGLAHLAAHQATAWSTSPWGALWEGQQHP